MQPNTPATGNTSTRAAVRAAQRRRRTLILVAIIVVLAIAFAVVLAIFFTRGGGSSPEQEVPSTGECLPASLRITTDPALEGAIEAIIADMTEGDPADCPAVTVRVEDSSITAAALGSGTAPDFDVWVPDSAMWPARA
ncbi:MAG: substrate-binding domain-containing protein, partial [Actinomycetota bacterium]|nr:substrate-binding domain-containing protein [Actinomycetota bacterium]